MVKKEDLIIFICNEINRHEKEADRLREELRKVRTGEFAFSQEEDKE